jgi:hypothetical protein
MNEPTPHERRVCGALNRSGRPCQRAPAANGRCNLHGGKSLAGIASPTFKHGRRSVYLKLLPREIGSRYKACLDDPELVSLKEELALQKARIAELCGQLNTGPAPPWAEVNQAFAAFRAAQAAKDVDAMKASLAKVEQVIAAGMNTAARQAEVWEELLAVIQQKTRTAAAEWKRLGDLQGLLTVEDALAFAKCFIVAAREVVTDPDVLARLQERTLKLLPPA